MVDLEELEALAPTELAQARTFIAYNGGLQPLLFEAIRRTASLAKAPDSMLVFKNDETLMFCLAAALLEEISAGKEREAKLRAAIAWVGEVTPRPLPLTGVTVEMTLEEFNAMRELIGRTALTRTALGSAP